MGNLYLQVSSMNWFARTSLECVCNMINIFFRGPCLSRRLYMQQTTCSPQFVVPELNVFHVGGWRPYCVLKWHWIVVRDCNSASHNMHWTCSCGVDIVTELARGHQLASVHKLGMKKNFQSFPFQWHKLDTCMTISFQDISFLFWIPFIQTHCISQKICCKNVKLI
jgi:hypothetical protein